MINFICSFGFIGFLFLLLSISYILYISFLFLVYKIDNGKLNIIEYFKRMI